MANGDFKNLPRRTITEKILRDKASHIAKNPKYDGYQRVLLQWLINFMIKKTSGDAIKNENMSNQRPLDLAEDLQNQLLGN